MWYQDPLVLIPFTALSSAGVLWLVTWLNSRKASIERTEGTARLEEDLRRKQLTLEAELHTARLNKEIDQQKREQATLARLDELAKTQATMATVLDESHAAINSSRTALETVLAKVQTDLKTAEMKNSQEATLAALQLQAAKDLHKAEIDAKTLKIDELQRQLFSLGLALAPGSVIPVGGLTPPLPPAATPAPNLVIHPSETAKEKP